MTAAKNLSHWDDPRSSIATKYLNNDFAYVSRGASIAMDVLKLLDITPSQAKKMTILDYGCGTGRAASFLSRIFGKVIGYDPNINCIATAAREEELSDQRNKNVIFTSDINQIPVCDVAFSTNVIEHLSANDCMIMIKTLGEKVSGQTILWYEPKSNVLLEPYIKSSKWSDKYNSEGRIQIDFFDFSSLRTLIAVQK